MRSYIVSAVLGVFIAAAGSNGAFARDYEHHEGWHDGYHEHHGYDHGWHGDRGYHHDHWHGGRDYVAVREGYPRYYPAPVYYPAPYAYYPTPAYYPAPVPAYYYEEPASISFGFSLR
jgi:hypothetical protein